MKTFIYLSLFILNTSFQVISQELWTATSSVNSPIARWNHTAVWTGSVLGGRMIIWGGSDDGNSFNTGGTYDPLSDTWTNTSTVNAPIARENHTAVWTGSKMIIWGGYGYGGYLNTGGIYDPLTNTWTSISTINAPGGRYSHTAVWTGSKMIIWGGVGNNISNTGGIYDPLSDTWTTTSTVNVPTGRNNHTAVWTGSKMIIWGGYENNNYQGLNTGGTYDPLSNTWTATSTANAPTSRYYHTAVWTGSKMIIWGGISYPNGLNTGGIYDPLSDTWTATSTVNVPTARFLHTAVWTGSKMIIWGGDVNTGGIYDTISNTWTATSTVNSPTARSYHTAVWTDNKMIIWGGYYNLNYYNTGGVYSNSILLNINKGSSYIPGEFRLYANYPNPFNPSTKIKFEIPKSENVIIKVFDISGKEVSKIINQKLNAGVYETTWNGSNYASGIYFYRLEASPSPSERGALYYAVTKKMILIK